jgi:hypothetical protein
MVGNIELHQFNRNIKEFCNNQNTLHSTILLKLLEENYDLWEVCYYLNQNFKEFHWNEKNKDLLLKLQEIYMNLQNGHEKITNELYLLTHQILN